MTDAIDDYLSVVAPQGADLTQIRDKVRKHGAWIRPKVEAGATACRSLTDKRNILHRSNTPF